eukprot:5455374-Prymnesium_polylepis.1
MEQRNLIWEDFDATQEGGKKRRVCARLKNVPKADYLGLDENLLAPSKPPPPPKKIIVVHDAQDLQKECVAVQRLDSWRQRDARRRLVLALGWRRRSLAAQSASWQLATLPLSR